MLSFGARNYNLQYMKRECAYALIMNEEGQFLCVKQLDKDYLFLVGGGIEEGETPIEALHRECLEETGYTIEIKQHIGDAEKQWISSKYPDWSQHNIAHIYEVALIEQITAPIELEPMIWVSYEELEKKLYHEHHLYLVKQHLRKL